MHDVKMDVVMGNALMCMCVIVYLRKNAAMSVATTTATDTPTTTPVIFKTSAKGKATSTTWTGGGVVELGGGVAITPSQSSSMPQR